MTTLPVEHSKPWTPFATHRLGELIGDGKSVKHCAAVLGRTPAAVRAAAARVRERNASKSDVHCSMTMPEALYDDISALAAKQGRSRSSLIRRALLKYLEDARV